MAAETYLRYCKDRPRCVWPVWTTWAYLEWRGPKGLRAQCAPMGSLELSVWGIGSFCLRSREGAAHGVAWTGHKEGWMWVHGGDRSLLFTVSNGSERGLDMRSWGRLNGSQGGLDVGSWGGSVAFVYGLERVREGAGYALMGSLERVTRRAGCGFMGGIGRFCLRSRTGQRGGWICAHGVAWTGHKEGWMWVHGGGSVAFCLRSRTGQRGGWMCAQWGRLNGSQGGLDVGSLSLRAPPQNHTICCQFWYIFSWKSRIFQRKKMRNHDFFLENQEYFKEKKWKSWNIFFSLLKKKEILELFFHFWKKSENISFFFQFWEKNVFSRFWFFLKFDFFKFWKKKNARQNQNFPQIPLIFSNKKYRW